MVCNVYTYSLVISNVHELSLVSSVWFNVALLQRVLAWTKKFNKVPRSFKKKAKSCHLPSIPSWIPIKFPQEENSHEISTFLWNILTPAWKHAWLLQTKFQLIKKFCHSESCWLSGRLTSSISPQERPSKVSLLWVLHGNCDNDKNEMFGMNGVIHQPMWFRVSP